MINIVRCIKSDFIKVRHTPFIAIHIFLPVAASIAFSCYFKMTNSTGIENINAFLEAIAIAFPFAVGIVVSIIVSIEKNSGNFQLMLSSEYSRNTIYISKLLFLIILSVMATVICTISFGILFPVMPLYFYVKPTILIILTSIPIYMINILIGFNFGKVLSMGIGVIGSLISALMLTGLGDNVWKFIPWAWGVRYVDFYLLKNINDNAFQCFVAEIKHSIFIVVIYIIIISIVSLVWFNRWEGQLGSE